MAANTEPLLTVIVPAYNEERTIGPLMQQLIDGPYPDKQVIVVDDASMDGTWDALAPWISHPGFFVLRHEKNQGKGAAIRTALAHAKGTFTIFQDADLEYDPADYPLLIEQLRTNQADVVFGSRYLRPSQPLPWTRFRLAVCVLNGLVGILYGRLLSDMATCYKAVRTETLHNLGLRSARFEIDCEITAKLCRTGRHILEVPISYRPRTVDEGKKIGWRDAWRTAWALVKWRFLPIQR